MQVERALTAVSCARGCLPPQLSARECQLQQRWGQHAFPHSPEGKGHAPCRTAVISVSSSTLGGLVDYYLLPRAALVPLSWAGAFTDRGAGSSSLPPIRVLFAPTRHPTLISHSSGTFILDFFRKAPEKPSFWKVFGNLTPRTWPLAHYHSPLQTLPPRPPAPTHPSPLPHDPSLLIPHSLPLPALPVGPSDFTIGRYLALPQVGRLAIPKLTCWVHGTNLSTLERNKAWARQLGEFK